MIGSIDIPSELLDNEEQFKHLFFNRFKLRHAPVPLDLGNGISKNYLFPALYGDASCAIGIYHCDYEAAKAEIEDPAITPVKMSRGGVRWSSSLATSIEPSVAFVPTTRLQSRFPL